MAYRGRLITSPEQFLELSVEEQKAIRSWWKPQPYDDIHIIGHEWPMHIITHVKHDDGTIELAETVQRWINEGQMTKEEYLEKYPGVEDDKMIPLFAPYQLLSFLGLDSLGKELYDTVCDDLWEEVKQKLRRVT